MNYNPPHFDRIPVFSINTHCRKKKQGGSWSVDFLQAVERSGSVVECLFRDRGASGLNLTGVTVLCPLARTLILAYSNGSTQEDLSLYIWKIVDGT